MCSEKNQPDSEDPARLMPRVIAGAWAVLATRPPGLSVRQQSGEMAPTRKETDDD